MRDAFFDTLYEIAGSDPDVILLTDDQGAFGVERICRDLPDQYINVGIAEQNLISLAAGLALAGKRPYVYGISTFMTLRPLEQINVDLCANRLPVTIVASGAGYTYSADGPTHHAVNDMAIMRTLPNMTILVPSDATLTAKLARYTRGIAGPSYVRIEKGVLPDLHSDDLSLAAGFVRLRSGSDLTIVSTGVMVHRAIAAAETLAGLGVETGVVDVYRVKPLDAVEFLSETGDAPHVTLEDHSLVGGLGGLVSEAIADGDHPRRLLRLGLPDTHAFSYGSREWMHSQAGLDERAVVERTVGWL